jgi:hypothetical protein
MAQHASQAKPYPVGEVDDEGRPQVTGKGDDKQRSARKSWQPPQQQRPHAATSFDRVIGASLIGRFSKPAMTPSAMVINQTVW